MRPRPTRVAGSGVSGGALHAARAARARRGRSARGMGGSSPGDLCGPRGHLPGERVGLDAKELCDRGNGAHEFAPEP